MQKALNEKAPFKEDFAEEYSLRGREGHSSFKSAPIDT